MESEKWPRLAMGMERGQKGGNEREDKDVKTGLRT